MLRKSYLALSLLFIGSIVFADLNPSPPFSVRVLSGASFPLSGDTEFFSTGAGGSGTFSYRFPGFQFMNVGGSFGYSIFPVGMDTTMSVIWGGLGCGIVLDITDRFIAFIDFLGGYYYSLLNDGTGPQSGHPLFYPGAGLRLRITPILSLEIGGAYRNYIGLLQTAEASLGLRFHFGQSTSGGGTQGTVEVLPLSEAAKAERLQITETAFQDIFPVFYKYYDENPIGTAMLSNNTDEEIGDIGVSLFIRQYMDNPKSCSAPVVLKAGEKGAIELKALFTEKVLQITESTKVSAEITLDYTVGGRKYRDKYVETVRIYDRNATTWDDDRKVAAFVTAKDPAVLTLSKNVVSLSSEKGKGAVNPNLRTAMAMHNALRSYGMSYVVDPRTPYKELSESAKAVDFLQFPKQSLQYRAGDCDDLSILTCSLLESVGIETAFITVPGHIFIAFSLGITPDEAKKIFLRVEDLIFHEDAAWVPVEITQVQSEFLEAWSTGAREWREAHAREVAHFYPTHTAWEIYEPVGLPGGETTIILPDSDDVAESYMNELTRFVEREIYPATAEIEAKISQQGEDPKLINKLGLLYARYGLLEKAKQEFERILALSPDYLPALVNMGNLEYLAGELKVALRYFEKASDLAPENPTVLLGISRINHDLENYGIVNESYKRLKEVKPDLARRFSYLDLRGDEAEKAAAIGNVKEEMVWEE